MGLKKKFKNFINKIIDILVGETASQKANKTLKMFGMNIFSNLIICGKLPKVPNKEVYFLSLAELERLRTIFSKYNENAAKIQDSILSPIIDKQIKSNEKIMECFKNIENAINKIPIKGSDKLDDTYKTCFEAVKEMMKYMYGLRAILASKVEQNSIKGYVDSYLDVVLKAKPDGGVYWEEFLIWISKIIDPNLAHLGELQTRLLKAELPLEGYRNIQKNEKTSDKKTPSVFIEEVRAKLVNEYRNRDEDNSSDKGGIGQTLLDIFSGKTKEKMVEKLSNKCKIMGEQILAQKLSMPEIKLMSKLISSDKIKFMGFKWAKKIKSQLEAYLLTPVKNDGVVIYGIHNQIINQVVPILEKYINLKKSEIEGRFVNCSDYESAGDCLTNIKSLIKECFTDLQLALKDYKNPIKDMRNLYLENSQGVDLKELKKFFRVTKNKKVMFFEDYVHELYCIAGKSIIALDKVIVPASLYIDTEALQIDSAKFSIKDKKWKTFNTKDVSRRITQELISKLKKIQNEIDSSNKAVNELKSEYSSIKSNWEKCNDFYIKHGDAIKNEKEKTRMENIVKEIEELSKNIESKFSEYERNATTLQKSISEKINGKERIRKTDLESFRKELDELKTGKRELEKLKSDFDSKVKKYRKSIEDKESKSKKQMNSLSKEFDEIVKSINESYESINKEYEALETLKRDLETVKSYVDKRCESDKNKKGEIATIYKNFSEAENKLLPILKKSKESLEYWHKEVSKENENFKNILGNKNEGVFVKEKECANILGEIKLIKEQKYDPLLKKAKNEIEELNKLYNYIKTALLNDNSQGVWGWIKNLF